MRNGSKINSKEQELKMIEEYKKGAPVQNLIQKYGYKTKKSLNDKIRKYYPNQLEEILEEAFKNRKGYNYTLEKIENEFDAYFLGLLLTDGYINNDNKVGIDLTDEDCIQFLSKTIGKSYSTYEYTDEKNKNKKPRHRLILHSEELVRNLERLGVVKNKTKILQGPQLLEEEKRFIPYLIRGIIDGDGCVSPTNYGAPQFYICSASEQFADWCVMILENYLYMKDIHKRQNDAGLWRIETANYFNILKLIAVVYDKPFGMNRKYKQLRKTFNDYNSASLLI